MRCNPSVVWWLSVRKLLVYESTTNTFWTEINLHESCMTAHDALFKSAIQGCEWWGLFLKHWSVELSCQPTITAIHQCSVIHQVKKKTFERGAFWKLSLELIAATNDGTVSSKAPRWLICARSRWVGGSLYCRFAWATYIVAIHGWRKLCKVSLQRTFVKLKSYLELQNKQ